MNRLGFFLLAFGLLLTLCLTGRTVFAQDTLPRCGEFAPASLADASPAELTYLNTAGPTGIWGVPWLLGCRPASLHWQDSISRARHFISLGYDAHGRLTTWRWEARSADNVPRIMNGRVTYAGNGHQITSREAGCPGSPGASETRRYDYDAEGRLAVQEINRPQSCQITDPQAVSERITYAYPRSDNDENAHLPKSITITDLNTGSVSEHEFTYHRSRVHRLLERVEVHDETGALIEETRNDFNNAGRVDRRIHFNASRQAEINRFSYDEQGRMATITSARPGSEWNFSYRRDGRLEKLDFPTPWPGIPPRSDRLGLTAGY